jgi:phage terminase large subunit-like protein
MSSVGKSEGSFVIQFIEAHCRITKGGLAGQLVKLTGWQKDLILDLFALEDGLRRYRRAYIQMARKNGKTFLMACVALYEAVFGELGGEVYFVAGDRMQASRAFGEIRKIVQSDPELRGLFTFYKHSAEVSSTGTILRVLSAEAGLQLGLEPSFVVFDEVAVQPNDRLWNAMSLGSGTRSQPMIVGISTPGWERDSLAYRLYQHGRKVASGEIDDPTFFFRCWEPSDPEADHTDPKVWAEANPSLGAFLHAEDFAAAVASTDETSSDASASGSGPRRIRSPSDLASGRPPRPSEMYRTGRRSLSPSSPPASARPWRSSPAPSMARTPPRSGSGTSANASTPRTSPRSCDRSGDASTCATCSSASTIGAGSCWSSPRKACRS